MSFSFRSLVGVSLSSTVEDTGTKVDGSFPLPFPEDSLSHPSEAPLVGLLHRFRV